MAAVFGLVLAAQEKPTMEFQDAMKSNAEVTGPMGLRAHITAKDYDAVGKDAATLRANFTKIEAFWTQRKTDDAIAWSKAGVKAAADLDTAAKAKDDAGIAAAQRGIAATCRDCHQEHRLMLVTENRFEIK